VERRLLAIYLNDHLAGATVGLELARRARASNEGNHYGGFLAGLAEDIDADRDSLLEIMGSLGVGRDRLKVGAAWIGEKLGRLKLNGRLTSYSPLSRLMELEMLLLGVTGKLSLWRTLSLEPTVQIPGQPLQALIERAESQRAAIEEHRAGAAREVLSPAGD
jgi:hypothetical protein